jgi:hypothetical protein
MSFKKGFTMVFQMLLCRECYEKGLHLKAYKQSFIQGGEPWLDGRRAGLNDVEKWKYLTLQGLDLRPLGRPARSQSLYRLSYRRSSIRYSTGTFYSLL